MDKILIVRQWARAPIMVSIFFAFISHFFIFIPAWGISHAFLFSHKIYSSSFWLLPDFFQALQQSLTFSVVNAALLVCTFLILIELFKQHLSENIWQILYDYINR